MKQLSVFLENRTGRLEDVVTVLRNNGVSILSLSLADTKEFGMLRLLADRPDMAYNALKRNGFSCGLTDVLAVRLADRTGMLQELMAEFSGAGINVEYMYTWPSEGGSGESDAASNMAVVLKTSDMVLTEKILAEKFRKFMLDIN